jgi:DNA-binding HxlR family transcriptional regulator
MERTMNEPDPKCGLDVAFAILGGKWKPLALYYLSSGPRRFGELRRLVAGVSEKVLIQQLRELTVDGIVSRMDHREVPPRVEYAITDYGRSLAKALLPLCEWGNANRRRVERNRRQQATEAPIGARGSYCTVPNRGTQSSWSP